MPELWLSIPLGRDRHHEVFFMIGALGDDVYLIGLDVSITATTPREQLVARLTVREEVLHEGSAALSRVLCRKLGPPAADDRPG
jgi:hypothetical protein